MLWSLACRLLALPALCGVPDGVAALLMGANDAGCPAGTGKGCAWVRHESSAYNLSLGVIPLDFIPDKYARWAWIHDPSDPPGGAPAWHPSCIIKMA
eukprot:2724890-Pyramimonas_sp.AAC.1